MPDLALKPYRRGTRYLKAYKEFELLKSVLTHPHPSNSPRAYTDDLKDYDSIRE
jgi:hypothetical protein